MAQLKFILPYLLITALSPTVHAENSYDYISGGFQYSSVSNNENLLPEDSFSGYYLGGSWNFYENFFAEFRHEMKSKNNFVLSDSMIGLGYYYYINPEITVYAMLGGVDYRLTYDLTDDIIPDGAFGELGSTNLGITTNNSALAAELGIKWDVLDKLTIGPAVCVINYDEVIVDYRLDSAFEVYDGVSVEANVGYQSMDLVKTFFDNSKLNQNLDFDELNYQPGVRFSF
ncbi:hypothetical protein C9J01_24070 [Photobacterium rosenbergii]|uniref:Outer membrane protein beta-barrel domain-containing protein n=1 Tax=Photobacterium rosenbergii TaxID=294936 RepID=A0A2T3N6B9_9GAMM|nr:hypothetical protein [Photobacterium rosenbergii]PSW08250.1 hypothetical protein C9J01_24070 [Photobacterium rosenbergii]